MSNIDIFDQTCDVTIHGVYRQRRVGNYGMDHYSVLIFETGWGSFARGDVYILLPGDSLPPEDPMSWDELPLLQLDFSLDGRFSLPLTPFFCRSVNLNMLQTIFNRIEISGREEQGIWLRALISEIRYQHSFEKDNPAMELVMDICDELKAHPGRYRSIEEVPVERHYSREHLIRLFRKYKKATPHEYIIRNRINAAMKILETSGASIGEVAEELGYGDRFSFSKQFKKITGLTPSEYRRK